MEWENEGLQAFCEKHGKKKRQRAPVRVESRLSDTYQDEDYVWVGFNVFVVTVIIISLLSRLSLYMCWYHLQKRDI